MPTFHPPLANSSLVPISSTPYSQLNFHAVFGDNEDSSGTWEIWTDLPRLDEQGNVVSQPGEWRAIAFRPHQGVTTEAGTQKTNGHLPGQITLKSLTDYPTPKASSNALHLSVTLPTAGSREYAYTYRHITSSGETHWLGGIGGNGAIKLVDGGVDATLGSVQTGEWSGKPDHVDALGWHGVGIEWQGTGGASKPVIFTAPSDTGHTPSLLLLQATSPPHLSPFSTPVTQIVPRSSLGATQTLAIIDSVDAKLAVSKASALPSQTAATFGLSNNGSPREALTAAFKAAKINQDRFRLAQAAQDDSDDTVALVARSTQSDAVKTYLIIYSPPSGDSRDVSVFLPSDVIECAPIAVVSENDEQTSFLPIQEQSKSRQLHLHLEAGAVARVLSLAEFVELRGAGSDDPIWICAPDALSSEIGEEEIDLPKPASTLSTFASLKEVKAVYIADEDQSTPVPVLTSQPENENDSLAAAPFQDPEATRTPAPQSAGGPSPAATSGWWLFRLIGRFFADIWDLIMAPFRSRSTITSGGPDDVTNGTSSDEEEGEAQTPPDERTPLLGSTSMSRGTSSSSTAVDSLASPQSVATAKVESKPKYTAPGSVTPVGTDQRPFFDPTETPVANTVQIRSYAQMSFDHLPPFKFLLPPGTEAVDDKLRFAVKSRAGSEWKESKPAIKREGQGCVEVVVDAAHEGGEGWEVQVERL